jgi:hypothetical protein
MAEAIDGPVGVVKPGSWWRTAAQKVTNFQRDQQKLINLLSTISVNDGGKREIWAASPLAGPDGTCAAALKDAIWDFQVHWKKNGKFTNIDGVADPTGNTLKQMNALAGSTPPVTRKTGSALAHDDVPLALRKVDAAIRSLTEFQSTLTTHFGSRPFNRVTEEALATHFRLTVPSSTAPKRAVTEADIDHILAHFKKIRGVLARHGTAFTDGAPVDKNGEVVAAAAPLDGKKVIFSSRFRDFTDTDAKAIGPNSRAAILVHEGYHAVDSAKKSDADDIHISEFRSEYDAQPADKSLHNPSSYASFAAHIVDGKDPKPRFGLGPGRFR